MAYASLSLKTTPATSYRILPRYRYATSFPGQSMDEAAGLRSNDPGYDRVVKRYVTASGRVFTGCEYGHPFFLTELSDLVRDAERSAYSFFDHFLYDLVNSEEGLADIP